EAAHRGELDGLPVEHHGAAAAARTARVPGAGRAAVGRVAVGLLRRRGVVVTVVAAAGDEEGDRGRRGDGPPDPGPHGVPSLRSGQSEKSVPVSVSYSSTRPSWAHSASRKVD